MTRVYMLEGHDAFLAYAFSDAGLAQKLMRSSPGRVTLPSPSDLPIYMVPSFGEAKKQPSKLGDYHLFMGSRRIFSERAVDALSLAGTGHLFPVHLEGRTENFYWYWSTTIVDCLDESRTKRLMHLVRDPIFIEERLAGVDVNVFTTPEDQDFQFHLYVTEAFKDKIRMAKLKGLMLRRGVSDEKPWKSS